MLITSMNKDVNRVIDYRGPLPAGAGGGRQVNMHRERIPRSLLRGASILSFHLAILLRLFPIRRTGLKTPLTRY